MQLQFNWDRGLVLVTDIMNMKLEFVSDFVSTLESIGALWETDCRSFRFEVEHLGEFLRLCVCKDTKWSPVEEI